MQGQAAELVVCCWISVMVMINDGDMHRLTQHCRHDWVWLCSPAYHAWHVRGARCTAVLSHLRAL